MDPFARHCVNKFALYSWESYIATRAADLRYNNMTGRLAPKEIGGRKISGTA